MKHITITGMDRTGKTSLAKEIMDRINWTWHVYDRDPATMHVYNVLNHRIPEGPAGKAYFQDYFRLLRKFDHLNDLVILLKADPKEIEKRFRKTNEPPLPEGQTIQQHMKAIIHSVRYARYTRYIELDSGLMSSEQMADEVFKQMGIKA